MQHSNVQRLASEVKYAGLWSIEKTKALHNSLCSQPSGIEETLTSCQNDYLITFAPSDVSQTLKVATAWRNTNGKRRHLKSMALLLTLDIPAGCTTASNICDIWNHPLLKAQWKDVVTDVLLLSPQVHLVLTGAHGPVHTQKRCALITLGEDNDSLTHPRMHKWKEAIVEEATGHMLIVDVYESHRWKVHRLLENFKLRGVLRVENPKPSPGSSKLSQRSIIQIQFSAEAGCDLVRDATSKWIARQLSAFGTIVGWLDTMADPRALLLDMPGPEAALTHANLCSDAILIKPSLAIVRTNADELRWRSQLTEAWKNDPLAAGEKIRYRPSNSHAGTFAQIEATNEEIAGVKARK